MKDLLVAALQFLEAITRLAEAGILFWLAYSELRRRRKETEETEDDEEAEERDHREGGGGERNQGSGEPPRCLISVPGLYLRLPVWPCMNTRKVPAGDG